MTQIKEIQRLLQSQDLWKTHFSIRANPNQRGQSTSYFIYDEAGTPIYIAKFFDFFKNISIPPSIDVHSCQQPEDVIDQLADADDFMDDIGSVSDMFYYQKRSFTRYVQVCLEEDIGFPRIFAVKENLLIHSHFYGLLIEEAINGITLEDYLKSSISNDDRTTFAIDFLFKMSNIIEKFVKNGIVHRDLSPDNIMISNHQFIVIDPGVVKIISRNTTELGYVMGKRAYASPEQYWGHAVYADFTSDLYSLGLIAFEIVSGINPLAYYIAKNPAHPHEDIIHKFDRELEDIFFKHIDESETNQQLFIIIRKLLQPDKAYRFSDVSSFQEAMNVLKEGI